MPAMWRALRPCRISRTISSTSRSSSGPSFVSIEQRPGQAHFLRVAFLFDLGPERGLMTRSLELAHNASVGRLAAKVEAEHAPNVITAVVVESAHLRDLEQPPRTVVKPS